MRPTLGLGLYRLATSVLEPLAPFLLSRRARAGKEDPVRVQERLGHPSEPRPDGALIWLHGASVGESLSLLPLIERLRTARPELAILVTSGTVASAVLMARRLPSGVIHQYVPLDAPKAAARFLDHWRPDLIVFVESEIWPGLLLQAKGRGARLALLSARMSQSSLKGWARARGAARVVFGAFDLVMAQDNETAQGLTALGARDDGRLNLKLAGAPLATDPVRLAALQTAAAGRPVLLAASTHPGEDEIVRDAFAALAPGALLVIVPRHPVRGPAVAALFEGAGLASRGDPFGASAVYVADTLGELGLWFALARTALVGGSLLPGPGGHNPVEPAHLGCPILTGPHIDNWRGIYAALTQADAVSVVKDAPTLALAFAEALSSPATARAERARAIVAGGRKRAGRSGRRAFEAYAMSLFSTPRWWYTETGGGVILRALLTPPSWLWAWATARRIARARPVDVGCPVISVGNLTLGGAGKTPIAREILRRLREAGVEAHGLSRGHGGVLTAPTRVNPAKHLAADVGDEPLMLARDAPFWVSKDRVAGAQAAQAAGAEVIVLDDAHQNPSLHKTLSLVVVDGETRGGEWPFGDGAVCPAGPMREPLEAGLARADAVVVLLPGDLEAPDPRLLALFAGQPVLVARLEPTGALPPGPQLGFAGVAKPWKVERALKAAGCDLVDFAPFPDHAPFRPADLAFLAARAKALNAGLITTEKDWSRLTPEWRAKVTPWPVRARFLEDGVLDVLLERVMKAAQG